MSRYYDGEDDESFPGEYELWQANAERALKGKRGRKALAELREALLALPQKRLISSALCTVNIDKRKDALLPRYSWGVAELDELVETNAGEGVCAIGALLWHRKVKAGADPVEAFDSLPTLDEQNHDISETAYLAQRDAGLVFSLAYNLAYRNDETYGDMTPERRYEAFMAWLDTELSLAVTR